MPRSRPSAHLARARSARRASAGVAASHCSPDRRPARYALRDENALTDERVRRGGPVMEKRRLGRTGHMSSVVAFGAAGIGRVDQETADKAIQTALDYGVNHIDVAPSYGEAELRFHDLMPKIRD